MLPTEYNSEKISLIKNTIAKGSTDLELQMFIEVCKRTGLDPFARQIYMIERRFKDKQGAWQKKMEIQTSVDGLRLIAERTGDYAGQLGPMWCGDDGVWVDVWLKKELPRAAKVGILRSNFKEPLWTVALWDSYAQFDSNGNPSFMWKKMPELMLAKVAESLGLRKAFPQNLSGLYTKEEMDQATVIDAPKVSIPKELPQMEAPKEDWPTEPPYENDGEAKSEMPPSGGWPKDPEPQKKEFKARPGKLITDKQAARLFKLADGAGWSHDQVKGFLNGSFNCHKTTNLDEVQYEQFCDILQRKYSIAEAMNIPLTVR